MNKIIPENHSQSSFAIIYSLFLRFGLYFYLPAFITYIYNFVALDMYILDLQGACFHLQFKRGTPPSPPLPSLHNAIV